MKKFILAGLLLSLTPLGHANGVFGTVGYHDHPLRVSVGFKHHDHHGKYSHNRKQYRHHYKSNRYYRPRSFNRGYQRGFNRGYYAGKYRSNCRSGY